MNSNKPHIEVNELDEKKKSSLKNRLLVAGILIVVCVPCLFLGGWFYFALISAFLLVAVYEIIHTSRRKYPWYIWAFTYLIAIVFAYWVFARDNIASYLAARAAGTANEWTFTLEMHFDSLYLSIFSIAVALGGYFLFSLINKDFTVGDAGYFFLMTMLVGLGFQALLFCRYYPFAYGETRDAGSAMNYRLMWDASVDKSSNVFRYWHSFVFVGFVIITTIFNDIWAYFVGMLFGKHKMIPRISPNKTWEGFFGGWILGGLTGLGFIMITDACGYPMLPTMKIFGENTQWWWAAIFSLIIPLVGDVGDLAFSFIKRSFNIKDYSKLLGAHGGALDRADSLIFTCIFAAIFSVSVTVGWNFFI